MLASAQLPEFAREDGAFGDMQELSAARMSLSKASEAEWNLIMNNLIEGCEENEEDTVGVASPPKRADHRKDMGPGPSDIPMQP